MNSGGIGGPRYTFLIDTFENPVKDVEGKSFYKGEDDKIQLKNDPSGMSKKRVARLAGRMSNQYVIRLVENELKNIKGIENLGNRMLDSDTRQNLGTYIRAELKKGKTIKLTKSGDIIDVKTKDRFDEITQLYHDTGKRLRE